MSTAPGPSSLAFPIPAAISFLGTTSANITVATHYLVDGIPHWMDSLVLLWFVLALLMSGIGLLNSLAFGLGGHERIRFNRFVLSENATKALTLSCYLRPWLTFVEGLMLIRGRL